MNKTCSKCLIEKPLTEFYKEKSNGASGRHSSCKECKNASTSKWRIRNKESYNASMRTYYSEHRDQIRSWKLMQKYGVTLGQKEQMLVAQGGGCWICKKTNQSKKRPFAVDHHPITKKTRGILCYGCNRAIHILDRQELLDAALAYLEHFK